MLSPLLSLTATWGLIGLHSSLDAGDFLGPPRDEATQESSRIGEIPSREDKGQALVAPAQRPELPLLEELDEDFRGDRSIPLTQAELRFVPTQITGQFYVTEVDPNGPFGHLNEGDTIEFDDDGQAHKIE